MGRVLTRGGQHEKLFVDIRSSRKHMVKRLSIVALGTGLLLLIPLALQLTIGTGVDGQGFNWKLGDFVVIGTLLFVTGIAIDYAIRKIIDPVYRVVAVIAIVLVLLLIWADLAVGIFNIPGISGS